MRRLLITSFVLLIVSLAAAGAFAQQANNPPFDFPLHGVEPPEKDWYRDMVRRDAEARRRMGPPPEPQVIKKGPLAPAAVDRKTYAAFLQAKSTGLIKLLPQTVVTTGEAIRNDFKNGDYRYSFSYRLHNYEGELVLTNDVICQGRNCQFPRKLSTGGYGLLTNLGEVALTDLNANDARARFMVTYVPSRSQSQARCEMLAFRRGVEIDGQHYQNGLPVKVGSTYLLRAFDYWRSDVLVAFQVVREDSNGSLTIAWKLLQKFTPLKMETVLYVNQPTDKCPIK